MTIVSCHVRMLAKAFAVTTMLLSAGAMANDLNVQQAVDRVQQETNGKVLSVQTMQVGKRKVYRIKVLTPDGQVRVIEVKADQ